MFKYFNKMSLFLPMVKTVNVRASGPYFKESRFLSTTPRINVISSPQCLFSYGLHISKAKRAKFEKDFEETAKNKDGLTEEEFKKAIVKSLDWITDGNAKEIWDSGEWSLKRTDKLMSKEEYINKLRDVLGYRKSTDSTIAYKFGFGRRTFTPEEAIIMLNEMNDPFNLHKLNESDVKLRVKELMKYDKDGDGIITLEECKEYYWTAPGSKPYEELF